MNTNTNGTKVTKAALLEFLRRMITTNEIWAKAALLRIYSQQTADEQRTESVNHENGVGFTGGDSRLLTRFAQWYKSHGWLSPKQMAWVYRKIGKYAAQLMRGDYFNLEKLQAAYLRSIA